MTEDEPAGRVVVTWLPTVEDDREDLVRLVTAFAGTTSDVVRVVRACRSCGSTQHGKPQVIVPAGMTPLHVSISRSTGRTVIAVTDAGPVGIDVEAVGSSAVDLTTWIRKESLVKATGHGLTIDPDAIELTASDSPPGLITWPGDEPIVRQVQMFDVPSPTGFVAAVTVLADVRPRLVTPSASAPAAPAG